MSYVLSSLFASGLLNDHLSQDVKPLCTATASSAYNNATSSSSCSICVHPLVYKSTNRTEPFLPPVRIFTQLPDLIHFCSDPDAFTALRTFCILKNKENDLQFVLELIHVFDYVCQAFLNAEAFFDAKQVQLLLAFRQLPRSILVVNGRFVSAAVLPHHEPNENPEVWVSNATLLLWHAYLHPSSKKQISCAKHGWVSTPGDPSFLELHERLSKLVDCLAVAYRTVERLLARNTIEEINVEVARKTGDSFIIRSPSMRQKWNDIRQYELQYYR